MIISEKIISDKDCIILKDYILDKETYFKSLGQDSYLGTSDNSLTGRWKYYNIMEDKTVNQIILVPIRKFLFKHNILPSYCQGWANIFRNQEGIKLHQHGNFGWSANIFIFGNSYPGTFYENIGIIPNETGVFTFFDSSVFHGVEQIDYDLRISFGFDFVKESNLNCLFHKTFKIQ